MALTRGMKLERTKRIKILDVSVDMVEMDQALDILKILLKEESCSLIVTPNSEIIVNAGKDKELADIIESADLIIPDGIGLVYASRLIGQPFKERVTGIDFLSRAFEVMAAEGKSVYLLGSLPGKDGDQSTAKLAAMKIKETFPGIIIAGTHHGYFSKESEKDIVEDINKSKVDFLCVALGSPKQEKFIASHRKNLNVKVAIGVGGSLDVFAGTMKRAPEFYRKHGLEWLYRFVKEPSRYKRLFALPEFMIKVLIKRLRW